MEIMCSEENKCVRLGQVWMTKDGERVQVFGVFQLEEHYLLSVRHAGDKFLVAIVDVELDYLISGE